MRTKRADWYRPGNWALPDWWTSDIPSRATDSKGKPILNTIEDLDRFYTGEFCRNVLGHKGGRTVTPATVYRDSSNWEG